MASKQTSSRRAGLALAVLCISLVVIALDATIVNVAAPTLSASLHTSADQLQWVLDAYMLAFAVLLLTCGHVVDRVGRKTGLIAGLAIFGLGSALATLATVPDHLIAARAFMGLGAAFIMPATLSSISHIYRDPHERARALSLWSATLGLGAVLGPIIGGKLLQSFGWESVFWVNVPIALVGIAGALPFVPNSRHPGKRADIPGLLLSAIGLVALVWGIIEAPLKGWSSAPVVLAFVVAAVAVAAFLLWERRAEEPLVPLRFFRNARFSMATVSISIAYFGLMGALFLCSQYIQSVLGFDAYGTGLRLLPEAIAIAVFAALSNLAAHRVGTKIVVCIGLVIMTVSLFLLARTGADWTYAAMWPALIGLGAGIGTTMAPCEESVIGSLPQTHTGVGSAVNSTLIQVASALGVAVFGSLQNTPFRQDMMARVAQLQIPTDLGHIIERSIVGAGVVAQQVGGAAGAAIQSAANAAFVHGMDSAMIVGGIASLLGAGLALAFLPAREAAAADAGETGQAVSGTATAAE